jgi:hypothetical protein
MPMTTSSSTSVKPRGAVWRDDVSRARLRRGERTMLCECNARMVGARQFTESSSAHRSPNNFHTIPSPFAGEGRVRGTQEGLLFGGRSLRARSNHRAQNAAQARAATGTKGRSRAQSFRHQAQAVDARTSAVERFSGLAILCRERPRRAPNVSTSQPRSSHQANRTRPLDNWRQTPVPRGYLHDALVGLLTPELEQPGLLAVLLACSATRKRGQNAGGNDNGSKRRLLSYARIQRRGRSGFAPDSLFVGHLASGRPPTHPSREYSRRK